MVEHVISPKVEQRLMTVLGNPMTCPHGNPIPGTGARPSPYAFPLSEVRPGQQVVVERIVEEAEDDLELMNFYERSGLKPRAPLDVVEVSPAAGLITVVRDGERIPLGIAAASKLRVVDAAHADSLPPQPRILAASGPPATCGRTWPACSPSSDPGAGLSAVGRLRAVPCWSSASPSFAPCKSGVQREGARELVPRLGRAPRARVDPAERMAVLGDPRAVAIQLDRLREQRLGAVVLAAAVVDPGELGVRRGVGRVELDGPLEPRRRVIVLLAGVVDHAPAAFGPGVGRRQLGGLAERGERLVVLALRPVARARG